LVSGANKWQFNVVMPCSRGVDHRIRKIGESIVYLSVISGAGHFPNLEQPQRFNHLIKDFLG